MEKKNFIVSDSALQVLMEAVQIAHKGTTLQVMQSFFSQEITEYKPETAEADAK